MDINLSREDAKFFPAQLTGRSRFSLTEKDRLRMQVKEFGEAIDDILDETVPNGKDWQVTINVSITETDI